MLRLNFPSTVRFKQVSTFKRPNNLVGIQMLSFRYKTALLYSVPVLLVLIFIPILVYVENIGVRISFRIIYATYLTLLCFQTVSMKLFALSRYIHKNRNVAQIFSFIMAVAVYLMVMLQTVSSLNYGNLVLKRKF